LITVQLRDQYSNDLEVSDGDVVLSLDPATPWTLEAAAQDQNNGTWTATLAASQDAGTVTVNGTLDTGGGTQNIGTSASVTFEQQQADATNSTVVASPTTIEASNGSAQSTVTVTAKDANDRAIKDASVTLTSDGENNTISATATTDGNGEATFTFSSTKAQTKNLSAEITAGGVPVDLTDAETVTVTPAATAFFVIINPTDGTVDDPITVTVEATDAFANLVESEDRDVDLVAGGAATGDGTVDIQNGVGTIDISNETAETVNLSLDNGPAGVDITSTEAVVFDPGAATKYLVTVSDENVSAGSDIQVSAQLADQYGNSVATENLTVTWAQDPAAAGSFSSPTTDTNASGVAVVTFTTSSTAGIDHTITATDNSNPTPLTGTSPTITTQ
jgi:adhesin/invasin